jgi:DNA-binding response OmpR family regulator
MNPQGQKTILIAEDEPFLRKMLVESFQYAGFQVLEAADGEAALNHALTNHPDVSVLDIMMPKMDGMSVLQRIRQDLWGRSALVIMLTNLTADNQILQGVSQSLPSYYFVKSNMEPDQLVTKVAEILEQQAPAMPASPVGNPVPQPVPPAPAYNPYPPQPYPAQPTVYQSSVAPVQPAPAPAPATPPATPAVPLETQTPPAAPEPTAPPAPTDKPADEPETPAPPLVLEK